MGGGGSISRRLSAFGHRPDIPSPRRASSQLPSPPLAQASEMSSRSVSSQSGNRGFVVHRPHTHVPASIMKPDATVPLSDGGVRRPTPRTIASTGSIDMLRTVDSSPADSSQRRGSLQRRRSSDIDSNASSSLGHRLINMLTLNPSRSRPRTTRSEDGRSGLPRAQSSEAMSGESIGRPSLDMESISTESHRADMHWGRLEDPGPVRRDSIPGETFQPIQPAVAEMSEDEDSSNEVDWVGDDNLSDGDDIDPDGDITAPSLEPIPDMMPITISTPPRQGSPRSINPHSPGRASSSPSWARHGDRARSPLHPAHLDLGSSSSAAVSDGGLDYVSKRSRKGSVLGSDP
jgi:hypothetical protein